MKSDGKKKSRSGGGIKNVSSSDHILLDLCGAYREPGICPYETAEKSNILFYLIGSLLPGWRLFLGKALAQPSQNPLRL